MDGAEYPWGFEWQAMQTQGSNCGKAHLARVLKWWYPIGETKSLLDFLVNGVTFEIGIVFFDLNTAWGIATVFGGRVTGRRYPQLAGLGALDLDIDSISFFRLCHGNVPHK